MHWQIMCLWILKLKIIIANSFFRLKRFIWTDAFDFILFDLIWFIWLSISNEEHETIANTHTHTVWHVCWFNMVTFFGLFIFGTLHLFLVLLRQHLWVAITRHRSTNISKHICTEWIERTKKGRKTRCQNGNKKEERKGERCRAHIFV